MGAAQRLDTASAAGAARGGVGVIIRSSFAAFARRVIVLARRAGLVSASRTMPAHQPRGTLFDRCQHLLRLAQECPPGPSGDAIRRAACELIEASSTHQQDVHRRRLLKNIGRMELRGARGRQRDGDPSAGMLRRLADALRAELHG